jgi:hypothetical protein
VHKARAFSTYSGWANSNTIAIAETVSVSPEPTAQAGGLPDPGQRTSAFEDAVGHYLEVSIHEFVIDQPRPEQFAVPEQVATDVVPRLRGGGNASPV